MFSLGLILLLVSFNPQFTLCLKEMCGDNDLECYKKAVKERVYPLFVAGIPGVVDPSDPLNIDTVIADTPAIKYSLHNAAMTGLKDCHFVQMNISKVNTKDTNIKYEILCPRLSIQSDYEAKGQINAIAVEGKGPCRIEYDDYQFTIFATNERINAENGDQHHHLLHYDVLPELKGAVKYDYRKLVVADQSKADEYIKTLEEITRRPVIDIFVKNYMENLKKFLNYVPTKNLYFKTI